MTIYIYILLLFFGGSELSLLDKVVKKGTSLFFFCFLLDRHKPVDICIHDK